MLVIHCWPTTVKSPIWFIFPVEVDCNQDYFNCSIGNLHCIPLLWVCDGDEDCTDGSDEDDGLCGLLHIKIFIVFLLHLLLFSIAGDWKCHEGGFKCSTGNITCINSTLLCDGYQHCSDASDEKSCGRCCKPTRLKHVWDEIRKDKTGSSNSTSLDMIILKLSDDRNCSNNNKAAIG